MIIETSQKAEHIEWFLTFAFGNRIALTVDSVNIEATDASALPTHSRSSYLPSVERLFRGGPKINKKDVQQSAIGKR